MSCPKMSFKIQHLLLLLFLSHNLYVAFAASGGVMGGSTFTSESKTTSFRDDDDDSYYRSRHSTHYVSTDRSRRFDDGAFEGNNTGGGGGGTYAIFMFFVGIVGFFIYLDFKNTRSSIIMIQVGLSGQARSLKRDLNTLAKSVDTSNAKGWSYILTETALALLRHPEYIISGYTSVESKWSLEKAEKHFKQLSTEERAKFDMETLVNVNNIKIQRENIPIAHKHCKDYIVITILVAARGSYQLPAIKGADDINKALQNLGLIKSDKTLGVEVLWTPQDENDVLSEEEYLENYPLLRPV